MSKKPKKEKKKLNKKQKAKLITLLLAVLGGPVLGTWFVVTQGPPNWVDPNTVGDDEVLAKVMMQGNTIIGGCSDERTGFGIDYDVLSQPDGFIWSEEAGDPNVFSFEFTPSITGIYYARVRATIVKPYEAGEKFYSLAFNVKEPVWPLLKWWYEITKQ